MISTSHFLSENLLCHTLSRHTDTTDTPGVWFGSYTTRTPVSERLSLVMKMRELHFLIDIERVEDD